MLLKILVKKNYSVMQAGKGPWEKAAYAAEKK